MTKKEKILLDEDDWELLQQLVSEEKPVKGKVEEDAVVIEFEPRKEK